MGQTAKVHVEDVLINIRKWCRRDKCAPSHERKVCVECLWSVQIHCITGVRVCVRERESEREIRSSLTATFNKNSVPQLNSMTGGLPSFRLQGWKTEPGQAPCTCVCALQVCKQASRKRRQLRSKGTLAGRPQPQLYRQRSPPERARSPGCSAARAPSPAALLRLPVVMEMGRGRLLADWLPARRVGGAGT